MSHMKNLKLKLIIMNFLEFAVWGAYLTSMGTYLLKHGMLEQIGAFYAVQGIVSLFMPALIGIIADRWMQAQKVMSLCHGVAGFFMLFAAMYAFNTGENVEFFPLFTLYSISVAFFMPTIGLANSVAYYTLEKSNLDTVKHFPPIRIFGTIGFICSMLLIDFSGFQATPAQFLVSGGLSIVLAIYTLTMPSCPTAKQQQSNNLIDILGLRAFSLFKQKQLAIFFIFSMLLGVALQITNGFANPFITSFENIPEFKNTFGVSHANALISLSQISETLCILLIPFFLKRFGIKRVMLIAMGAWVLRFALFGFGNPGSGVWMFILSMIVYGMAFDFFNISGSLYVDQVSSKETRSSAQGLFMMMTNGIGATIGTLGAQKVIDLFVDPQSTPIAQINGWSTSWLIFATYALVVMILFAILFKYKHIKEV